MELLICDNEGLPLDAAIEIEANSVVLQSRGGTKGSPSASNTDYSDGLRFLLERFGQMRSYFVEAFVDSSRVQKLPVDERMVLTQDDMHKPSKELFTLVSKRMQSVGKPSNLKRHTGNANKRVRFCFSGLSIEELERVSQGISKASASGENQELSSADMFWTEGSVKLVTHLKRERGKGLSEAKKTAFIRENGKLFCERCDLDPVVFYGDRAAQSCIEVHHKATMVSDMVAGHVTRLEDLQCLCANCHRYVHIALKKANRQTST